MNSLRGVSISEDSIGINVIGDDREFGLIGSGVETDKLKFNTCYKLRRMADAKALGLKEEYDSDNRTVVFRHISEFFRMAGEGRILNFMLVPSIVKPSTVIPYAKKLVIESGGMIADLAIAYNPDSDNNLKDGLNAEVREGIPVLQAFAEWAFEKDMPLHIILSGFRISDDLTSLANLRELKVSNDVILDASKVSIVIGSDWNFSQKATYPAAKYSAEVGNFLGVLASQKWNENPAEVATKNISNASKGLFTEAGLSNGQKYSEVFEELETLDDKGYIFPISYQGISGFRWSDAHVCSPIIIDNQGNMNQHTIYYSHTINQVVRALRKAYLPEVKKVVPLDSNTGKLPIGMLDYYDSIGGAVFSEMSTKGLISGGKVSVDPESDLTGEKVLKVGFSVVPTGCINEIKGFINLKTTL